VRVALIYAALSLASRFVVAQTRDLPPLEPFGRHLRATIQLEGEPDWLAPHGNRVWALTVTGMALVDPEERGPVLHVPVRKPCGAPVSAYGALWVASCAESSILRIDLSRGEVVANVSASLVEYESSLAAADSSIWFISDTVSTLTRLDVGTNRVVARIRVRPGSTGVAAGFGAVWVSNTGPPSSNQVGSIQRVDPSSNRVRATIAVGREPRFLTAGEGAVWVLNQGDGTVTRIDPATNQVATTIEAGLPGPGGDIAAGGGRVWVRAEKVLLTVIDPESNRIVHRFKPPAGSGAVRVGAQSVWVSAHDINTIWELYLTR
jgi:virginiamycin B lyase